MAPAFIIAILIGWYLARSLKDKSIKSTSSYIDLGDNCWLTPQGFVDLTPRLTPEQEWHNRRNVIDQEFRDRKYAHDLAWAEAEMRIAQYQFMKHVIDQMSPEEKLQVWFPKWVDYICDWHLIDKDEYEKELGYMSFDCFIATETIPFKWYGMKAVFKESAMCYIEYVV